MQLSAKAALRETPNDVDAHQARAWAAYHENRMVEMEEEYRCQYPGCSVMCGLHPHHIVFRSHTGKKSRAQSDSPSNVLTLCFVHHRMLHAGNIGLSGKAPADLQWRRPELMESTVERFNELAAEAFEPNDFELPGQEQGEPAPAAPA